MDFSGFLDGLIGALQNALQSVIDFLRRLLDFLSNVLTAIITAIQVTLKYAGKALQSIGRFFRHIWEGGLSKIFTRALQLIRDVSRWLEQHLAPVLRWLRRARELLDRWYRLYLRPYLQMLQRIRGYLRILRLLHIKWADALDRRLAQAESQAAHNFLLVRAILNDVITFVNSVSDPRRLARMVIVASAGRRTGAAIIRAFTGLPLGFFFPHTGKGAFPFERPVSSSRDLSDPQRNPPASDILGGLLALPLEGFTEADPTPDNAELDALESSPYFGVLGDSLLSNELALEAIADLPASLLDAITDGSGLIGDASKPAVTAVS